MTEFKIILNEGEARIYDAKGQLLGTERIRILFTLVNRTIQEDRLRKNLSLADKANWVFPSATTDRRQIRKSGPCVYFLTHPKIPGIKIGRTGNLSSRTCALAWKLGVKKEDIEILAFARTPHHKELEHALLFHFRKNTIRGREWFESTPVQCWLREAQSTSEN